jgi:hypothetical protein
MISDAADQQNKREDSKSNHRNYKFRDDPTDKKTENSRARRQASKGSKSFASGNRGSPLKMTGGRSGNTSPEYNIYSDSEHVMVTDNDSPLKEGGSAEELHDDKSTTSKMGGHSSATGQRSSIAENRLAQNGGNIVHQKPVVK